MLALYSKGPVAEEFVFRAHMVPLLLHEGYTPTQLLFITPIYFALAHVHHFRNHGNIAEVCTYSVNRLQRNIDLIALQSCS
jgi:membrane protease YdiL (CAAX protease family)